MKKKLVGSIIKLIVGAVFGFACGYLGFSSFEKSISSQQSGIEEILKLGGAFLCLIFGFVLHMFLHELGHLLFGKRSGYDFVSFRIGNIMFIKENGKLVRKKFNIVGTGGQCLMSPPEPVNDKFPYILYNLGGSFLNFISSGVCYLIYVLLSDAYPAVARVFIIFAIVGLFIGLTNIIPAKTGGIANDGYNALTLGKDEKSRRAFWLQLHINALTTKGVRYRDMPAEWFRLPSDDDLNDVMIVSVALCSVNYLIDKQEFEKAAALARHLLETADKMLEVYKNELHCELLFLEIIGECRKEEIDRLYTKQLKNYIKNTSSYVSRQRLIYTYAKLVSHDNAAAEKAYKQFAKTCTTYPNAGEVAGERDLINWVEGN